MGKDSVASLSRGAPRAQAKNHRKKKRFWQIFVGKIFLFSKFGRSKVFSISNFSKIWDFSFVAPPISAIPGLSKICSSPILPNLETVGHPWVLIWQKLANLNFDQPSLSQNWEKSNLTFDLFSFLGKSRAFWFPRIQILAEWDLVGHNWVFNLAKLGNQNCDLPSLSQNWGKYNLTFGLFSFFRQITCLLVSTNPNFGRIWLGRHRLIFILANWQARKLGAGMIIFAGKWDEQQDHLASLDLAIAGNSQPVSSHPFAVTFSISFLFVDDRIHRACRQASYCIHHKAEESYSI